MGKLAANGVNVERLQAYQKAYDQAMMQQQQAEAAQAEVSSVNLEEVLGN